jgi:hypothetical protein
MRSLVAAETPALSSEQTLAHSWISAIPDSDIASMRQLWMQIISPGSLLDFCEQLTSSPHASHSPQHFVCTHHSHSFCGPVGAHRTLAPPLPVVPPVAFPPLPVVPPVAFPPLPVVPPVAFPPLPVVPPVGPPMTTPPAPVVFPPAFADPPPLAEGAPPLLDPPEPFAPPLPPTGSFDTPPHA